MAKVYKSFYGKPKDAFYQLSQDEINEFMGQVNDALEKAGGKRLVMCDSGWWSDQWNWFGIEEFPDIEAVQKHSQLLNELKLFHYIESVSMLGTEWQGP